MNDVHGFVEPEITSRQCRMAIVAISIAAIALLAAVLSGFGSRSGLWTFRTGFTLLRYAAFLGIAGALIGIVAAVRTLPNTGRRGLALAIIAVVVGGIVGAVPISFMRSARGAPPIHDISTDMQDPPQFLAVLPLRANASNPATYGGPEVAAQQQAAYPDIRTEVLRLPAEDAFQRALAASRDMGWELVATEPEDGRIEATASTFWFGFKDDVVIRIRPEGGNSRVDVRSVSRVGRGDVGTNAKRVRRFLEKLRGE